MNQRAHSSRPARLGENVTKPAKKKEETKSQKKEAVKLRKEKRQQERESKKQCPTQPPVTTPGASPCVPPHAQKLTNQDCAVVGDPTDQTQAPGLWGLGPRRNIPSNGSFKRQLPARACSVSPETARTQDPDKWITFITNTSKWVEDKLEKERQREKKIEHREYSVNMKQQRQNKAANIHNVE